MFGLIGAEVINRTEGKRGEQSKTRPADEEESRRWLTGAETAGEVLRGDARMITMVEDREGDISEDQFARRPAHVHLLVRAAQNRSGRTTSGSCSSGVCQLVGGDAPDRSGWPRKSIGGTAERAEGTAVVAVRYGEVTIKRPAACRDEPAADG